MEGPLLLGPEDCHVYFLVIFCARFFYVSWLCVASIGIRSFFRCVYKFRVFRDKAYVRVPGTYYPPAKREVWES